MTEFYGKIIVDKHREMYAPRPETYGYVFEFVRVFGRAFALVRDSLADGQGEIIWRSRGATVEWIMANNRCPHADEHPPDISHDYPLEKFKTMDEIIAYEFPGYWTAILRAKALAAK